MKRFLLAAAILAFLPAACGAPPAPTADPAQLQASAIAAANTAIALTQTAVPTSTPLPPTPLPSATLFPSPGLPTPGPSPTATAGADPCLLPLDVGRAGPTHRTIVRNQTRADINLALTLYKPNASRQCGAISFSNMQAQGRVTAELPEGDWFAYAWSVLGESVLVSASGSFVVHPEEAGGMEVCVGNSHIVYASQC
jgi:hypothetical protein